MYHTRLLVVQKGMLAVTLIKSLVTFLAIHMIQLACKLRNQAWPRGIEILARGEVIVPGCRGFQHLDPEGQGCDS